jgi:hypothetical protein
MTNADIFSKIDKLDDDWCERRALKPLRFILRSYPLCSGLTDEWGELLDALKDIKGLSGSELTNEATNHPKQKLLFFVAQDLDDTVRANVCYFVRRLASLRRWVNGPPRLVNSRDEPADTSRGDMPAETVGGYLEVYSALPPWTLPREIDLQHLDEVTALVGALRDFSHEHSLAFEMELGGTFVGAITDGEMDRSLAEGPLGGWRRQLGV